MYLLASRPVLPTRRAALPGRCSRLHCVTPRASLGEHGVARPVMLPTGTLWILPEEADRYYNVRASSFVIERAEALDQGRAIAKAKASRTSKAAQRPAKASDFMHQAVWHFGPELTMLSENVVDIPENWVQVLPPDMKQPSKPVTSLVWVPRQETETGIVRVHDEQQASSSPSSSEEVIQSDSTSPRRTKMLRFRCVAPGCGVVNLKPMNPHCFNNGTAFAQCSKCGVWHLIRDHLELFNQMKGPVFKPRVRLSDADLPPSLRLGTDPSTWAGKAPKDSYNDDSNAMY